MTISTFSSDKCALENLTSVVKEEKHYGTIYIMLFVTQGVTYLRHEERCVR